MKYSETWMFNILWCMPIDYWYWGDVFLTSQVWQVSRNVPHGICLDPCFQLQYYLNTCLGITWSHTWLAMTRTCCASGLLAWYSSFSMTHCPCKTILQIDHSSWRLEGRLSTQSGPGPHRAASNQNKEWNCEPNQNSILWQPSRIEKNCASIQNNISSQPIRIIFRM